MDDIEILLIGGINEGEIVKRPYGTEVIEIERIEIRSNDPSSGNPRYPVKHEYKVHKPIELDGKYYVFALGLSTALDDIKAQIRKFQPKPISENLLH